MLGEYNKLMSTGMDESSCYPIGRTACFDIGISGNCIGNCLLCRAFEDDFNCKLIELEENQNNVIECFQELLDMGLIDLNDIKEEYINIKNEN